MASTYAKTRRGQEEIETRSDGLGPRDRRLLILIDGKRTTEDIRGLVGDPALERTLETLREAGYIEAVAAAAEAEPAPPAELAALPPERSAKELEMARNFMTNTLRTFNGPYAKLTLMEQIQGCDSSAALRALFDDWMRAIGETQPGRKRADELRERLLSVL